MVDETESGGNWVKRKRPPRS